MNTDNRYGKVVQTRGGNSLRYRLSSVEHGGVVRSRLCSEGFGRQMVEHAPISGTVLLALLFDTTDKVIVASFASRDLRNAIDLKLELIEG